MSAVLVLKQDQGLMYCLTGYPWTHGLIADLPCSDSFALPACQGHGCCLQLLRDELGKPPSQIFSSLTPSPVAAASLGQVIVVPASSTLHAHQSL